MVIPIPVLPFPYLLSHQPALGHGIVARVLLEPLILLDDLDRRIKISTMPSIT